MAGPLANTDFMDFDFRLQADPTRVRIQVPQAGMSLDLANAVALLMPGPHLIEIGMTLDEIKRVARPEMGTKYGPRTVIWKWFDEHEFRIPVVSRALGWYTLKALDQCPRLKPLKYITKLIDTFSFDIQFWAWELVLADTKSAFATCLHRDLPAHLIHPTPIPNLGWEDRPAGCSDVVWRLGRNPIILHQGSHNT